MRPSTKNQILGKIHEINGNVKVKLGQAANDSHLADQGRAEKLAGKIQKKFGQLEKVFEK